MLTETALGHSVASVLTGKLREIAKRTALKRLIHWMEVTFLNIQDVKPKLAQQPQAGCLHSVHA